MIRAPDYPKGGWNLIVGQASACGGLQPANFRAPYDRLYGLKSVAG
jgi:hypothetical protein